MNNFKDIKLSNLFSPATSTTTFKGVVGLSLYSSKSEDNNVPFLSHSLSYNDTYLYSSISSKISGRTDFSSSYNLPCII